MNNVHNNNYYCCVYIYALCVGFPTGWCIPSVYCLVVYPLGPPADIHCMQHTLISLSIGDGGFSFSIQKVGGLA